MGNKKEYIVDGLDCANCAAKIEDRLKKVDGISDVNVNFLTKKLVFNTENDNNTKELERKIQSAIDEVEDGVVLKRTESSIEEDEYKNEFKKDIIKVCIALVLFLVAMIADVPKNLEIVLFALSYLIVGLPVVITAVKNIAKGKVFDENFLMTIATIGAFAIGEFGEGVAVMLFYQVGELFQNYAVNNSRKSIKSLLEIRPDFANLVVGDDTKKVTPDTVKVGDTILVKVGERIPLDGVVVAGQSSIDTSALTGESKYRDVYEGDEVLSGTVNINGVLTIRVTKEFGESTVTKILELVENASSRKADTENFITKFAKYYTPAVVIAAVAITIIPPLFTDYTFVDCLNRALVFLVISCPCALVISIPLGYFSGIGACSKNGILVKGSNYLEALNSLETIIFDKTGTLTKGDFSVTKVVPFNGYTEDQILEYSAYAESLSNHPIALSIIKAYGKDVDKSKISNYTEIAGYGISVLYNNKTVLVGNKKLLDKENIASDQINEVGTIIHIAVDNEYIGYVLIEDAIKEGSIGLVKKLKDAGVKQTIMLTGDNKDIGNKVADKLGIDECYAELLPKDKFDILEKYDKEKSAKGKIAFVGDGINDAPVIARADIGFAMGGIGQDVAIESADIVLMNDDPSKIVTTIEIAKTTQRIVMQNIIFALGVKGIILILGFFGIATMWEAVFADVGVSMIAILNSMRIQQKYKVAK